MNSKDVHTVELEEIFNSIIIKNDMFMAILNKSINVKYSIVKNIKTIIDINKMDDNLNIKNLDCLSYLIPFKSINNDLIIPIKKNVIKLIETNAIDKNADEIGYIDTVGKYYPFNSGIYKNQILILFLIDALF